MKTSVPAFLLSLTIIFNLPGAAVAGNPGTSKPYNVRQFFRASLYTNTGVIADGNIVAFDEIFNNGIDGNDARKMMNPGENFSIMRNTEMLAIEARLPVQLGDTIFYDLQNLRHQDYQLRFKSVSMEATGITSAYLVDKYLQTSTFINLTDSSSVDISITADAGSSAADRFYVIFNKGRMRELSFINLSASWNISKTIDLAWNVANERDVDHYTIERSSNGLDFTAIGTKNPASNNGGTETYAIVDANANRSGNYYRISAIDQFGQVKYSLIVNSGMIEDAAISIYPNPVKDKIINLHFVSQLAGKYKLQLSNKMGQVVYSATVNVTGTNQVETIKLDHMVTPGTYQLSIIPSTGKKITRQVMVQ